MQWLSNRLRRLSFNWQGLREELRRGGLALVVGGLAGFLIGDANPGPALFAVVLGLLLMVAGLWEDSGDV